MRQKGGDGVCGGGIGRGRGGGRREGGTKGSARVREKNQKMKNVERDEETPIGSSRARSRRPKPRKEKQISSNSSSEEGPLSKTVQEHSC